MKQSRESDGIPWLIIIVLSFIFVAGFIATFVYYYNRQTKSLISKMENNLAAVADYKVAELVHWRRNYQMDAMELQYNGNIAHAMNKYFRGESGEQKLIRWIDVFFKKQAYTNATVLDSLGNIRFSYGIDGNKIDSGEYRLVQEALKRREYILSDFHISEITRKIEIDLAVPISSNQQPAKEVLGLLLFRIDPYTTIYPILQSLPIISSTVETILFRRETAGIVVLNELRHRKNTALRLRWPLKKMLSQPDGGIDTGEEVVETLDYRDISTMSVIRKIPDSPWMIATKVDYAEIYSSLSHELLALTLIAALLIISVISSLLFWWRHQRSRYYRNKYQIEIDRLALLKHYDYLVNFANDMIFLFDDQGRIAEVNDQACKKYGYSRAQFLQMQVKDICREKNGTHDSNIQEIMKRIVNSAGLLYETQHVHQKGNTFPVEVSSRIFEIDGKKYVQAIIRDITQRKEMEAAIRENDERFRLLMGNIDHVFWLTQLHPEKLLYLSPSFVKIWDAPVDDLYRNPRKWIEYIHPEDRQEVIDRYKGWIQGGDHYEVEYRILRQDGEMRWIHNHGTKLYDQTGKLNRIGGIAQDITERKLIQNEIQLSLREKETLLMEIHHRVKNNLQIISSMLKLQSGQIEDQKINRILKDSQNHLRAMASVHTMLYKSKNFTEINFGNYIRDTGMQLFRAYDTNPETISLSINADDVMLPIDTAIPCGLIINELFTNTLKYAFPKGSKGKISIFMHQTEDCITLLFEDNGIGLPANIDFNRTETFGLDLIRLLVEQLDGVLAVNSNGGTKYSITLTAKRPVRITAGCGKKNVEIHDRTGL